MLTEVKKINTFEICIYENVYTQLPIYIQDSVNNYYLQVVFWK